MNLEIEDWSQVEKYNDCLQRLINMKKAEIVVAGPLVESKTAWKCAVLQQSLLYRVCALARGTADAWNVGNLVSAVLEARALMETVVVMRFVATELRTLREPMNVDAANLIDDLCNKQLFSTKNESVVAAGYGHMAKSILTYVDKMDKEIPHVREAYDFLSEWAHPNGSGHLFTFGAINKDTGHVNFHEAAPFVKGIQGHVVTCFMLIQFAELAMEVFEETIPIVAEVDKGAGPWVPGAVAGLKERRENPGS